jgi:hypothetical protein
VVERWDWRIHFGEGKAKLFPFSENVFMPGKSSL